MLKHHVDALLLALASSTDNFTVGVAVGLRDKRRLPVWANGIISTFNAAGALGAAYMGVVLSREMPYLAPLLAALAFGYLSVQELLSYRQQEQKRQEHKPTDQRPANEEQQQADQLFCLSGVLRLALPMTLNNLAGGVAGGAAGLSPTIASGYAFLASYVTMSVGFRIGRSLGRHIPYDPSLIAGLLLGLLCLITIQEALAASQDQPFHDE